MKRFAIYKNIRKRALIFGLPVSLFALQMAAVIMSLLVIIFSFGFEIIIGAIVFNSGLYIGLTRFALRPQLFQVSNAFPAIITNKKSSIVSYEKD